MSTKLGTLIDSFLDDIYGGYTTYEKTLEMLQKVLSSTEYLCIKLKSTKIEGPSRKIGILD